MATKKKSKAPNKSTTHTNSSELERINCAHLRTSIGMSHNTKPTNKHKRRSWKRYRGQGK